MATSRPRSARTSAWTTSSAKPSPARSATPPSIDFRATLEPAVLDGTRERLARAVNNLLDNAAKHSPPGGIVEVYAGPSGVSVRDHGTGVDAEDLPHLFDRFYRGASSRGRPGSGLGLAIVRQVAEQHGGTVRATNTPTGGAEFTLALPATAPAAADPSGEPKERLTGLTPLGSRGARSGGERPMPSMPRPPRPELAGGIHHVYSRGAAKQPIFIDDLDRRRYLSLLARVTHRMGWRCLTYCLMGNHMHLLIETPQPNLGRGMQRLHGTYAPSVQPSTRSGRPRLRPSLQARRASSPTRSSGSRLRTSPATRLKPASARHRRPGRGAVTPRSSSRTLRLARRSTAPVVLRPGRR